MVRSVSGQRPTLAQREEDRAAARANHGPTYKQVQLRAYQIYEARDRRPGFAHEDWMQAERELRRNESEIATSQ